MQIIKGKEKIGNIFFSTAIVLELLIMVVGHSALSLPYRGRIAQLAFVLFGCKILTTYYSKKQWAIIVLLGIVGCVSYFTCGDEYVLRALVMVFAAKNINGKKTLKAIAIALGLGTLVIAILAIAGVMGELVQVRDFGRGTVESRWTFGFSHANNTHDVLWYLTALYLLLREKKANWKEYCLLTAFNIGLFLLTVSRNGLLATQILICACAFFQYLPKTQKKMWPYILGFLGLAACIFFTVYAGIYNKYNNELIRIFNQLFTERLEMVWEHAHISTWELFPEARELNYVDNGFAKLIYCYGLVVGVGYWVLIVYLIYRFYKEQNGIGLAVLTTTVLVTFMESTFIFNVPLLCNPLFILLFDRWYGKKQVVEE